MEPIFNRQRPDSQKIKALLDRYVPVKLVSDISKVTESDQRSLNLLKETIPWVNRIVWKQLASEDLQKHTTQLLSSNDRRDTELARLLALNFGPWDVLDSNRPFWGIEQRPPGANFYPHDLQAEEFHTYLKLHSHNKDAFLKRTTLIKRKGNDLISIPYEEAYHEELNHIASFLKAASTFGTHDRFRHYLEVRSRDLQAGSLSTSDALWVHLADSPIDIAIGPFDVYDDTLLGLKATYEATIMIRHSLSDTLTDFEQFASELGTEYPGAVAATDSKRLITAGVYDLVAVGGMTNMGSKAMAATIPTNEQVQEEVGARLLLFRNVITAKFREVLSPLAARTLHPDQLSLLNEEAFLFHTLLHELTHALGTAFVIRDGRRTSHTINQSLRERYSTIEECRAEVLGFAYLTLLINHGAFGRELLEGACVTFVAGIIRTLRFGLGSDHARAAAIILSHLLNTQSIQCEDGARLVVRPAACQRNVRDLARRIQEVVTYGDYEKAGMIIQHLSVIPPALEPLLRKVTDVPVDLEFIF